MSVNPLFWSESMCYLCDMFSLLQKQGNFIVHFTYL